MKKKAILISLILTLALSACATSGGKRFRNLFEDDLASNRESVRLGSSPQTINDLSMLLEMDSKNGEARFLRALAYQKKGDYEKAAEDYTVLLKNNPDNIKANYNLAMIYAFKMHKYDEALKHFDRFITLNPDNQKNFQAAKIMLSLDQDSPESDPANLNRIIEGVLADQGMIRAGGEESSQKRRKTLADAIRSSPSSAGLHFAMAKSYEQDGKIDEAIKYYEAALELKPTYAECHYELGRLLSKTNKKDEGEMHLFKASLFRPNGPSTPLPSGTSAS